MNDQDGSSSLGLGHALVPLSIFVGCWWFAISESSPIKGSFWWQAFFLLIAPPLLTTLVAFSFR